MCEERKLLQSKTRFVCFRPVLRAEAASEQDAVCCCFVHWMGGAGLHGAHVDLQQRVQAVPHTALQDSRAAALKLRARCGHEAGASGPRLLLRNVLSRIRPTPRFRVVSQLLG